MSYQWIIHEYWEYIVCIKYPWILGIIIVFWIDVLLWGIKKSNRLRLSSGCDLLLLMNTSGIRLFKSTLYILGITRIQERGIPTVLTNQYSGMTEGSIENCSSGDRTDESWLSRKVYSSRGATLSFTLRSKGEGGQPRYLILQEIASHFSTPPPPHPPPPPPPPHLPRTLRADSKYCNLQYFCSFRIKKPHFATWWNLRKYHCFC